MHLQFGMSVVGHEGDDAGTFERALIDPHTREVTHLVVRSPRVSEDVLLPLSLAQGNAAGRLLLLMGSDELGNLPRYHEGRTGSRPAGRVDTAPVRQPAERRDDLERALAVPADALELSAETSVGTVDGAEGRLAGLATAEYTNRLSALDLDGLAPSRMRASAGCIGALAAGRLALTAAREQLVELTGGHSVGDQVPAG